MKKISIEQVQALTMKVISGELTAEGMQAELKRLETVGNRETFWLPCALLAGMDLPEGVYMVEHDGTVLQAPIARLVDNGHRHVEIRYRKPNTEDERVSCLRILGAEPSANVAEEKE